MLINYFIFSTEKVTKGISLYHHLLYHLITIICNIKIAMYIILPNQSTVSQYIDCYNYIILLF